jgi:hypothetical protein
MGSVIISLALSLCAAADSSVKIGCEKARAAASLRRSDSPTPQFKRTPRTTIVVDIDETLCVTDYNSVLWGIGTDDSRPLASAPQTLTRLARDYEIIYLTARPKSSEKKSRRWLISRGFPDGRIITSPTLGDFLAQTGFKKSMLARLQRQYGRMLIGIGDKPTDAEAYRQNGMLPLVVNPWKDRRYRRGELIFRDWAGVEAFFERNRELLTDSPRLAEALRDGNIPVTRSG